LADAGARVALVARRADRLAELAEQIGPTAVAIPADVTTAEAPDLVYTRTIDAFGRVDGLVNAAGRGMAADVLAMDLDTLDESFELNFVAPVRLIQRIVPALVEQGEGVVVNVSSPTSQMGLPGIAGYAAAKAALNALTVALRRELLGTGVHVMLVFHGRRHVGRGATSGARSSGGGPGRRRRHRREPAGSLVALGPRAARPRDDALPRALRAGHAGPRVGAPLIARSQEPAQQVGERERPLVG
jgi:NAD(P)-dependent dehydrogenase (short-subunit alcohol dehydrogenase family)